MRDSMDTKVFTLQYLIIGSESCVHTYNCNDYCILLCRQNCFVGFLLQMFLLWHTYHFMYLLTDFWSKTLVRVLIQYSTNIVKHLC